MLPFQIGVRFALDRREGGIEGWSSVYLGYARGRTTGAVGAFWGVGLDLAGATCGSGDCEATTAGFSLRLGLAQREFADGRHHLGRYGYLAITPLAVDPDDIGSGAPTRKGLRVGVGVVDPLRLRLIGYFRRTDSTGFLWALRALNSAELMLELCDGREPYCPRWRAGLAVGIGI
jgi:hypothetical protein